MLKKLNLSLKKLSSSGVIFLLVTSLILCCVIALNAWPVNDDYGMSIDVKKIFTPWSMAAHWYLTWSGRFWTTFVVAALFNIPLEAIGLVSFINFAVLISSFFIISKAIFKNTKVSFLFSLILFFAVVSTLSALMSQCVFWPSGGVVYTWPLLIFSFQFYLLLNREAGSNWLKFIVGFLTGSGHEVLSFILTPLYGAIFLSSKNKKNLLFDFSGFVLGAIAILAAPGNFKRAQAVATSFINQLYRMPSAEYIYPLLNQVSDVLSLKKVLSLIIGSLMMVILFKDQFQVAERKLNYKIILSLPLGTAGSLLFVLLMHVRGTTTERMLFFPTFAAVLGVCLMVLYSFVKLSDSHFLKKESYQKYFSVLAVLVCLGFFSYLVKDTKTVFEYKSELKQTLAFIEAEAAKNPQTDVLVSPIKVASPRMLVGFSLTEDASHFINLRMAEYYKVGSLKLTK